LEVEGAHQILQSSVEKSLSNSHFSSDCGSKSIDLLFIFKIEGNQTATYDSGVVRFQWPNAFTISVRPPIPQP
jgi:hypothetical protein